MYVSFSSFFALCFFFFFCQFRFFSSTRAGDTNTINDSCRLTIDAQALRRRSESDAAKRPDSTTPDNNNSPAQLRRVSLDSTESKSATAGVSSANASIGETIKCRNPKCEATSSPAEAKRNFKSCHNCKHKVKINIKIF